MATIKARRQANGTVRYPAVVRLRRGTTVLHQESKPFAHRSAAVNWAKHREVELENPGVLTSVSYFVALQCDLVVFRDATSNMRTTRRIAASPQDQQHTDSHKRKRARCAAFRK